MLFEWKVCITSHMPQTKCPCKASSSSAAYPVVPKLSPQFRGCLLLSCQTITRTFQKRPGSLLVEEPFTLRPASTPAVEASSSSSKLGWRKVCCLTLRGFRIDARLLNITHEWIMNDIRFDSHRYINCIVHFENYVLPFHIISHCLVIVDFLLWSQGSQSGVAARPPAAVRRSSGHETGGSLFFF